MCSSLDVGQPVGPDWVRTLGTKKIVSIFIGQLYVAAGMMCEALAPEPVCMGLSNICVLMNPPLILKGLQGLGEQGSSDSVMADLLQLLTVYMESHTQMCCTYMYTSRGSPSCFCVGITGGCHTHPGAGDPNSSPRISTTSI